MAEFPGDVDSNVKSKLTDLRLKPSQQAQVEEMRDTCIDDPVTDFSKINLDAASEDFEHVALENRPYTSGEPSNPGVKKVAKKVSKHPTSFFGAASAAGAVLKKVVQVGEDTVRGILSGLQMEHSNTEGKDLLEQMKLDFQHQDFPSTCKTISKRITSVSKKTFDGLPECTSTLRKADKLLENRQITVNMFAQCNTGKSTLLNAILGDNYLPIAKKTETCLRVLIQHDPSVHNESCPSCCTEHSGFAYLEVHFDGKMEDQVTGVKKIREKIKKENDKHRSGTAKTRPDLVLKANLPLLAHNVPKGWSVVLADNPGFGEAKEHITQVTNESWDSSAAYIYLTIPETKGLIAEVDLFKAFHMKGLLRGDQQRLIIVLNKIDTVNNEEDDLFEESYESVDDLREQIRSSVQEATGVDFPRSSVLPISARWAITSKKLRTTSEEEELSKWLGAARKQIVDTPSFACGQGCQTADASQLSKDDLCDKLYEASGLELLTKKISSIVGSACISIWGETLCGIYTSLLAQCEAYYETIRLQLRGVVRALQESVEATDQKLNRIIEEKGAIKETLRNGHDTELWKRLECEYESDVEESGAVESGIKLCELQLDRFKNECKNAIEKPGSKYSPSQFKQALEAFLTEMEKDLQKNFDQTCSFRKLGDITHDHIEDATARIAILHTISGEVCLKYMETSSVKHGTGGDEMDQGVLNQMIRSVPPKLGDIKNNIGIPNVKLNFILRAVRSIKLFIRRSIIRRMRRKSERLDSEEEEELDDEENDMPYKKWNEELDQALDEVKANLVKECRKYFPGIKNKTIQYFYEKVYKKKVEHRFDVFKRQYKEKLRQAKKEQAKQKMKLEGLRATYYEARTFVEHFEKLKEHIQDVHEEFVLFSVPPATA